MKKEQYLSILEDCMVPSKDMLFGPNLGIFQQDNDPKHTAHVVKGYIEAYGINVLSWPSQSPDLNPIENLWAILNSKCKNRRCNTAKDLFETLKTAWKAIPVETLDSLVTSMPRRCQAIIDSHGWPTKY